MSKNPREKEQKMKIRYFHRTWKPWAIHGIIEITSLEYWIIKRLCEWRDKHAISK